MALACFTAGHAVRFAAVDLAASSGFDTHAWQLAWTLTPFWTYQGHWHNFAATHHNALEAARRVADQLGQAHTHQGLGIVYIELARHCPAS